MSPTRRDASGLVPGGQCFGKEEIDGGGILEAESWVGDERGKEKRRTKSWCQSESL